MATIARFESPIGRKIVSINGTSMEVTRRADTPSFGPFTWVQDGRDETHAKREVEEEVAARLAQLDYLHSSQKRPNRSSK
jgi:hypothetical protein